MLIKDIEIVDKLSVDKPILMIDEADFNKEEASLSSRLYLSKDLYFWKHHFINNPTMPGMLLLEMLAQSGALLEILLTGTSNVPIIVSVQNVRFLREVKPEKIIISEIRIKKISGQYYTTTGRVSCEGKSTCKAELVHLVR